MVVSKGAASGLEFQAIAAAQEGASWGRNSCVLRTLSTAVPAGPQEWPTLWIFPGVQAHRPGLRFLRARQAAAPGSRHSVTSSFCTRKPAGLLLAMTSLPLVLELHSWLLPQSRGQDLAPGPDAGVVHLGTVGTSALSRSPWILSVPSPGGVSSLPLLSITILSHFPLLR